MTYRGRSIFAYQLPRSHVRRDPLFEQMQAGVWAGVGATGIWQLEGEEQSLIVAAYRCEMQLRALLAHEEVRKARQQFGRKRPPPQWAGYRPERPSEG